jgi:hypothetical protein
MAGKRLVGGDGYEKSIRFLLNEITAIKNRMNLGGVPIPGGAYEPNLGKPGVSGYILSSTMSGVRSWVAPGGLVAHQLDGASHTVSGLTPGHFLKATGAGSFGFAAHGLGYGDVGALAAGGTAADSAKLNGQSAAYYQVAGAKLAAIQALASAAGWLHNDGAGAFDYSTPTAANVGAEASGAVSTHNGLSTAHGFTTAGKAIANLANPGAITFLRVNANNSASLLSASNERTALGLAIGTNVQAYNSNLTGINQALDTTASPSWVTGKFSTSVLIGATAAVGSEKLNVTGALYVSGAVRMANFGAGAATFDASGNITSVSDERLKNIVGPFKRGMKEILELRPIVYKYKPESGMETEHEYAGFSAQQVMPFIPEAVGMDAQGHYTFADRPIIAALCNSIGELAARLAILEKVTH